MLGLLPVAGAQQKARKNGRAAEAGQATLCVCLQSARPRPNTEPTPNRLVGRALYGPAVVHCGAWASALRVALSSSDMDPMYSLIQKVHRS